MTNHNGIFLMSLSLAACGDKGDDSAPAHDPAEEACERTSDPGTALTAAPTLEKAASVVVEKGETPVTVTLPKGVGAPSYVTLHVEGEALLWVGTANVASDLLVEGASQGLPAAAPNEHCPADIPEHYDLDGDEFVLALGPAAVDTVWLLLSGAEGHGH